MMEVVRGCSDAGTANVADNLISDIGSEAEPLKSRRHCTAKIVDSPILGRASTSFCHRFA
jgi:hypothetical protein